MASRISRCICADGASISACYGGMVNVDWRCMCVVEVAGRGAGASALVQLG